jgi:hypothetical protein
LPQDFLFPFPKNAEFSRKTDAHTRFGKSLIAGPQMAGHILPSQKNTRMSTVSLNFLEQRLQREAPGLNWKCEPVQQAHLLNGTNLPEEIQVRATRGGVPVRGSPFYLSGECLVRWGVDASAALICNELSPSIQTRRHGAGLDWDRLAEI